jgi:hypothetical protein
VGPTLYEYTNVDDLANQADEMSHGWMRLWGLIGQAVETHPFMVYRIRAIVDWAGGLEPGHSLRLRDPNALSGVVPAAPDPRASSPPAAPSAVDIAAPVRPHDAKVFVPPSGAPPAASLLIVAPGKAVQEVELRGRSWVVGRSQGAGIIVEDPSFSRQHFRLYWDDGSYRTEDLGSSNGTKVNGQRVTVGELKDGDVIQAGHVRLELRFR